jgi:hypothetical protein
MKSQKSFANKGRTITTNNEELTWLAKGLHSRLKHYGDIAGVSGEATIKISVLEGDLHIEVDQNCTYEGFHNYNKGELTKRACEMALKSMLLSDLMWVSIPRKPAPEGVIIYDNTGILNQFYPSVRQVGPDEAAGLHREYTELWEQIRALPEEEQIQVYRFLD